MGTSQLGEQYSRVKQTKNHDWVARNGLFYLIRIRHPIFTKVVYLDMLVSVYTPQM